MRPFFFCFITFFIAFHVSMANNLINRSCKNFVQNNPNMDYDFCITSLEADPYSQNTNLQELGMISIRLMRKNITDTRFYIKNLIQNKKWDSHSEECLRDCYEVYSDAFVSANEAMKYYHEKLYRDVTIMVSEIQDAATTCEDEFNLNLEALVSSLTNRNNDTFQLSAIALSLVNMLNEGPN